MKEVDLKKCLKKIIRFLFRNLVYNPKKPKSSIINILAWLYLIILLFPYPFFQEKYTVNNFQFYSTDVIKNDELNEVISTVDSLLSASPLYDADTNNKLFICNNKVLYMIFSPLGFKMSFGINHPFTHNLYLPMADFKSDKVHNFSKTNNNRKLSSVLSHEIMHTYLAKYLWKIKSLFTKKWKKEGYCEYIANDSSFDVNIGFELIKSGETDSSFSFKYFKYRLYVTYLLDIKGIKLETLIESKFDMAKLDNEIKIHINSLEEIFNIRMQTDGITISE